MNRHHVAHYLIALVLAGAILGLIREIGHQNRTMQNALGIGHVGFGMFQETK